MNYENITRQHVLDAVAKIEHNNITLKDSTIYDVIINNKAYPLEGIMRYANELANGTREWTLSGNEQIHNLFKDLGFEILGKNEDKPNKENSGNIFLFTVILKKIGKENANLFFNYLSNLLKALDIKKGDKRIAFTVRDNQRLTLIVGNRYTFGYLASANHPWYFIQKGNIHHKDIILVDEFTGNLNAFGYRSSNKEVIDKYFDKVIETIQIELGRTEMSRNRKFNNNIFEKMVFDENYRNELFKMAYPINRNYWRIGTSDGNTQKSYWKEMQAENKVCIGWSEIGDLKAKLVSSKDEIINLMKEVGYYQNDNRTLSRKAGEIFNFYDEIKIGDVILAQDGSRILGIGIVDGNYEFNNKETEDFAHQRTIDWIIENSYLNNQEGLRTTVFQVQDQNLIKNINKQLEDYKNMEFVAFENEEFEELTYPLNQILYGPPGTGKTYKTVDLAYRITQEIEEDEEFSYEQARHWFNTELNKEDDRQLDFITFHQNYSYEDFVMGIKPDIDGEGLGFREHKGIFFEICQRALKNLQDSQKPIEEIEQEKNTEELFEAFKNDLIDKIENEQTGKYQLTNAAYISAVSNDAFIYTGDNWNQDGRMKFEDILKIYNNQNANSRKESKLTPNISRTAIEHITYYFKIASDFKDFTQKHQINSTKTEKIKLKNYVLIIDEINRANISRVFGELITLIEEDKRWGNNYPMEVRLPDGRTKFTVPKNLYIIGTMNTADKSIALLDIALRRRFEFTALYPDSSLIADGFKLFFETLNNKIKDKKGIDFMVGHAYFMAKKGAELDFIKTMNTKVIPLLNEYFYNTKTNQEVKDLIDKSLTNINLPYQTQEDTYQLKIINK